MVWRVAREKRDALRGARAGGRWDDGTFDVLYTSLDADGAIAELNYHLSKGLPVVPSRVRYFLHRIEVSLEAVLDLSDPAELERLGVDMARFGRLSYAERDQEYPTTQQIAEVASFLGFDAVLVPNARWSCSNLIVFTEKVGPEQMTAEETTGPIDWADRPKRGD
ncbi:MAG: RES family NAD+ phosphorylase [Kiloniellales bacterium]